MTPVGGCRALCVHVRVQDPVVYIHDCRRPLGPAGIQDTGAEHWPDLAIHAGQQNAGE